MSRKALRGLLSFVAPAGRFQAQAQTFGGIHRIGGIEALALSLIEVARSREPLTRIKNKPALHPQSASEPPQE